MKERIEVCKEHLEFSLKWKGSILGAVAATLHQLFAYTKF